MAQNLFETTLDKVSGAGAEQMKVPVRRLCYSTKLLRPPSLFGRPAAEGSHFANANWKLLYFAFANCDPLLRQQVRQPGSEVAAASWSNTGVSHRDHSIDNTTNYTCQLMSWHARIPRSCDLVAACVLVLFAAGQSCESKPVAAGLCGVAKP